MVAHHQPSTSIRSASQGLPHPTAEPTIAPPAITMMVVMVVSPSVVYLLDSATLIGACLQRLKHVGPWRGVHGSDREANRSAKRNC
jgi:hypothetical protein